jgi:hypothetical protein
MEKDRMEKGQKLEDKEETVKKNPLHLKKIKAADHVEKEWVVEEATSTRCQDHVNKEGLGENLILLISNLRE